MRFASVIAVLILAGVPAQAFALTTEQPQQQQSQQQTNPPPGYALYNPDMKFDPDNNANGQNPYSFNIGDSKFFITGSGGYGTNKDTTRPPSASTGNELFSPMTDWQTKNFPH